MHLLKMSDLKKADIDGLIERAVYIKGRLKRGILYSPLKTRTLGLIFEKPSTRTRVSFECAMMQLGGSTVFVSSADSQLGRGEPIKDTARVMSGYVDGVVIRTFGHERVEEFARYSSVPVINGLTDLHHPCQVLADIMTVVERKGSYGGIKVAWIGDGNNVANSWIEAAGILGFELVLACPVGYEPQKDVLRGAGKSVKLGRTVEEAAKDADVLNTDVWASMGQEGEREKRLKAFRGYQINAKVLRLAKKDAVVMHCLPAHRDEEITDDVIEGPNSAVWQEAENRLHVQKAVLERLLGDK
ncbi:MAG: ornithine carbamoyltransferase [Deltaproteobacteria bacterium]|nr:ornithine carbamoyltransferase [Deltaproteobacteria bacterium]